MMNLESQQKGGGRSGIHLTHSLKTSPIFCVVLSASSAVCLEVQVRALAAKMAAEKQAQQAAEAAAQAERQAGV